MSDANKLATTLAFFAQLGKTAARGIERPARPTLGKPVRSGKKGGCTPCAFKKEGARLAFGKAR